MVLSVNNLNATTIPLVGMATLMFASIFSLRGGDIAQVVSNMAVAQMYLESTPLFQAACVVNGELY